ncbi:helix-turn-helix domain-containing protein [Sulfurisphaera ohwakuensis]|uniref:Helix-turn-helix domain-containing protein n=1 Tax=Sulfurisphaera ohwakuensis TaxID=69656 RepID=A0A650CLT4_SULOH|nr:helix-turn-helix domain-containing protein [Sulfurisphaera ohwakuensis]
MKFLLIIIIILISLALLTKGDSGIINIYYNGTVVAELHNVSEFNLIGDYAGGLKVIGAEYNLSNGHLFLKGNGTIYVYYRATLPKGVIQIQENNNFTISIYLPTNSTITYVTPQPYSFTAINGLYNITFVNVSKVILLYVEAPLPTQKSESTEYQLIILLLIADIVLISLIVYFFFRRRKEARKVELEEEENTELVTDVLDERDKLVLNALKDGSSTLAEIIRKTNLPKATAYRRLKKLVKLGYVEEVRERGKIRYVLKKKD